MSKPGDKGRGDSRPPLLVAHEWLTQITTVVAEMVLPGLAGHWLDRRWGTEFLALIGFALGLTVGIWHLIVITRPRTTGRGGNQSSGNLRPGIDHPDEDRQVEDRQVGED